MKKTQILTPKFIIKIIGPQIIITSVTLELKDISVMLLNKN